MGIRHQNLLDALRGVATQYPAALVEEQVRDVDRIAFNISVALDAARPKSPNVLEICDLGGGIGLFSVGCAAYGLKRTVLVDDFNDAVNDRVGASILDLHRRLGVEIVSRNLIDNGIHDIEGQFDIITSFDSMEHWHHSPKRLFREVAEKLRPGGVCVLGAPNCVNLRKRITVPLGAGKWSKMQEWYEADCFRGHVREPDVDDLIYMAHDIGLLDIKILGRNWLGYHSANPVIRVATQLMDYPLRLRPSLCSDIYLVGKSPLIAST